jgi:glutamate racemase
VAGWGYQCEMRGSPKALGLAQQRSIALTTDCERPIGVFDSGAGGLTVVRTLLQRMPNERVVYFGDTAYVPYGPRPPEEIRRFAIDACRFLCEHGTKLIVMGCNMSSAMALPAARRAADCPVLGTVEAGAQSAVRATRGGRIGVAATEGTVNSGAYERAIRALRPEAEVFQQPCPPLVPAVEAGLQDGLLQEAVELSLTPLRAKQPDTVILGCTHYPLIRETIQVFLGENVRLIDPAETLAEQAADELAARDLLATTPPECSIECHASGPADSLAVWAARLLAIDLGPIEQIDIHLR